MQYIEFKKGQWEDYFNPVHTIRFNFTPEFRQEEDCISNAVNPDGPMGFDYATIMTKEKFGKGTKITTSCSFEEYGAPLITLTDKTDEDKDGNLWYGVCYEAVIWENGINIWEFYMQDDELKYHLAACSKFELEPKKKHIVEIEIKDKYFKVSVGDKNLTVRAESLPDEVYFGITGCENINRFYSVKIEESEEFNTLF